MTSGPLFSKAVRDIKILSNPNFSGEGFNGYIETNFEATIVGIRDFAQLWDSWYSLPEKERIALYNLAKGLGDRK